MWRAKRLRCRGHSCLYLKKEGPTEKGPFFFGFLLVCGGLFQLPVKIKKISYMRIFLNSIQIKSNYYYMPLLADKTIRDIQIFDGQKSACVRSTLSRKLNVLASLLKDVNWSLTDLNAAMASICVGTFPTLWFYVQASRFNFIF